MGEGEQMRERLEYLPIDGLKLKYKCKGGMTRTCGLEYIIEGGSVIKTDNPENAPKCPACQTELIEFRAVLEAYQAFYEAAKQLGSQLTFQAVIGEHPREEER